MTGICLQEPSGLYSWKQAGPLWSLSRGRAQSCPSIHSRDKAVANCSHSCLWHLIKCSSDLWSPRSRSSLMCYFNINHLHLKISEIAGVTVWPLHSIRGILTNLIWPIFWLKKVINFSQSLKALAFMEGMGWSFSSKKKEIPSRMSVSFQEFVLPF